MSIKTQRYLYNLATDRQKGIIAAVIKLILFWLSLIYGLIVRILIFLRRINSRRLNCKVISIGNITLGGTGKTSLVEYIARYLKSQGHKVAILTRGYKRETLFTEEMGDEPYMLQANLKDIPVIVDANRVRAANLAIREYGVDTVILDDGLQQWQINKDLEVVTIDANNPFGNRRLLPRGQLREPMCGLKRAVIFVLTKTNLCPDNAVDKIKNELIKLNPKALIVESAHNPQGFYNLGRPDELLSPEALKGKSAALFSGIADPNSFEALVAGLGLKVDLLFRFPDHYNYTEKDLDRIIQTCKDKSIDTAITTEKDSARLLQLPITNYQLPILILRIKPLIKNEQIFFGRLLKLYSL